jgi:hypothetical protein
MCKHRIVESHSAPAAVRGFRRFKYQDLSEELAQRIRSNLEVTLDNQRTAANAEPSSPFARVGSDIASPRYHRKSLVRIRPWSKRR